MLGGVYSEGLDLTRGRTPYCSWISEDECFVVNQDARVALSSSSPIVTTITYGGPRRPIQQEKRLSKHRPPRVKNSTDSSMVPELFLQSSNFLSDSGMSMTNVELSHENSFEEVHAKTETIAHDPPTIAIVPRLTGRNQRLSARLKSPSLSDSDGSSAHLINAIHNLRRLQSHPQVYPYPNELEIYLPPLAHAPAPPTSRPHLQSTLRRPGRPPRTPPPIENWRAEKPYTPEAPIPPIGKGMKLSVEIGNVREASNEERRSLNHRNISTSSISSDAPCSLSPTASPTSAPLPSFDTFDDDEDGDSDFVYDTRMPCISVGGLDGHGVTSTHNQNTSITSRRRPRERLSSNPAMMDSSGSDDEMTTHRGSISFKGCASTRARTRTGPRMEENEGRVPTSQTTKGDGRAKPSKSKTTSNNDLVGRSVFFRASLAPFGGRPPPSSSMIASSCPNGTAERARSALKKFFIVGATVDFIAIREYLRSGTRGVELDGRLYVTSKENVRLAQGRPTKRYEPMNMEHVIQTAVRLDYDMRILTGPRTGCCINDLPPAGVCPAADNPNDHGSSMPRAQASALRSRGGAAS